jgi:hypothetical protein
MSRFRVVDPNAPQAAEPSAAPPPPDAFDAAVTMARKAGARCGVLIWLEPDGETVSYRSIDAPSVLMRGMLEDARDIFLSPDDGA